MRVLRDVLVTFWNFKIPFLITCGMLRRPGRAALTENSRPLFWVWSLLCTWLKGTHTIEWHTDNQSVSRFVEIGSMKEDLQCLALRVFSMCFPHNIKLKVERIPRSGNDRADFLSRKTDYDD